MSGHSHYATIKHQKGLKDAQKGKVFSKLGRAISIAVKAGGGPDPEANYKLRMAIDTARASNMPKENIERAISKGVGGGVSLEEVSYEGFGPEGVAVIVEAATDNRNRTAQEIKNLFERGGGNLGGPGSVAFNFEHKGQIVVEKAENTEDQLLKLIDAGVDDVEESADGIDIYVAPDKLSEKNKVIKDMGFTIKSSELIQKPKMYTTLADPVKAQKVINFLDKFDENEDVQKVFANLDIPDDILSKISASL